MTCDRARRLLGAWHDGELDPRTRAEVEAHVAGCAECAARLERLRAVSAAVRAHAARPAAPAALRERIAAAVAGELAAPAATAPAADGVATRGASAPARAVRPAAPRRAVPPPAARWARPAYALAAMAAGVAIATALLGREQAGGLFARELVSASVRALATEQLVAVPSTDQHTVKPWFAGRLEFSPRVADLAAAGYPLAGGRLDVVDGRRAAVLVFRRGRHVVQVYEWPAGAAPEAGLAGGARSWRGYQVAHRTLAGMSCWAVSDAAAADVRGVLDALAQPPAAPAPEPAAPR